MRWGGVSCVCVSAGGAECPLLSKQQKCHPPPWWLVWALEILSNPRARLQNRRIAAKPFMFVFRSDTCRAPVRTQGGSTQQRSSGCAEQKQMTKLRRGKVEDWKHQRRVMPQINRCIMQELPERQFGITTQECETEAIKWMMSYSAEVGLFLRRGYLGQGATQQLNAIRTLQYHYNQRRLLGTRLWRVRHMCFSPICFSQLNYCY